MYDSTPNVTDYLEAEWPAFEPYYDELAARGLDANGLDQWLKDWSWTDELVIEVAARLYIALNQDTTDESAEARLHTFIDTVYQPAQKAQQLLKEKLLASELEPAGFEIALRNLKAEVAHFSAENLPLDAEELKLTNSYDKIVGAQAVKWEGQEQTLTQLQTTYQSAEQETRQLEGQIDNHLV